MLPMVFDNVDRAFAQAHPLNPGSLVKSIYRNGSHHCLEWTGIQLYQEETG
jgi:hypothetical protein